MRIGILGFGEIGRAIEELYVSVSPKEIAFKVRNKDLNKDEGIINSRYLHVCIPYSDDFVDQVCECIEQENPDSVIIHSTVQVGTTRKIMEKSGLNKICHAPVRGVHPNLFEGLKTFPMYLGYDKTWDRCGEFIKGVEFHFARIGVKTKIVRDFETSELAKLASTSYYGMCIAFHGEMQSLCSEMGLNFEDVMTEWNKGYNNGYKKLGMENVVRPVLSPPDKKIGGHCVIPNAKLLKDFYYRTRCTKELPDFILKYE